MTDRSQPDDETVMNLVELALAQPEDQRQSYLAGACSGNSTLFDQAWGYVQWESRMKGFLLDPLYSSAVEEHPFEPGQLLESRFRIEREVARGGMGVVYEAYDERLGRRIALKCAKAGFRQRLPPEVRHASEISHPNVCKIFEIHTASTPDGEIDFFTMEFLDGETLAARLGRGRLPAAEARAFGEQICAGLAEAHRKRVVHGDLKTGNVILAREAGGERAVITDFGLARKPLSSASSGPLASSGVAGGTPEYMAPELWKGEKPSPASDVFALGVILHELATGRRPAAGDRVRDPIVRQSIAASPAERFRDATAVVAARKRRRMTRTAAVIALAAIGMAGISGVVAYERAAEPKTPVRLVMLPLEASGPGAADLAERLSRDAAAQLARLEGGAKTRLSVVDAKEVETRHVSTVSQARSLLGATHVVHGSVSRDNGKVSVHAFLTDTLNGADFGNWTAEYSPAEVRYAPGALAGMSTAALKLPALPATVNDAARKDYEQGLVYAHRNSTVDRALPLLENAVAADPDSPLTWAGLAEAQFFKWYVTGDKTWMDRMKESVRQAQARNPDLAPVHRAAGLVLGLSPQAEAEYQRAIALDPKNGDAYRRLAKIYDFNHQPDRALALLKTAAEVAPNDFKVYQDLGAHYRQYNSDKSTAAAALEQCVRLQPDESDTHRALGTVYIDLRRYPEAERELKIAVGLAETAPGLISLASALMYQSRDQEAIPLLKRAAGLSANDSLVWMDLGIEYQRTSQAKEAAGAYQRGATQAERALAEDPDDGIIRSRLAFLAARLGNRAQAVQQIAEALRSSGDSTTTQLTAVATYETLGQRLDSLAILKNAAADVLLDVAQWPDLAELHRDPRFQQLLASHQFTR